MKTLSRMLLLAPLFLTACFDFNFTTKPSEPAATQTIKHHLDFKVSDFTRFSQTTYPAAKVTFSLEPQANQLYRQAVEKLNADPFVYHVFRFSVYNDTISDKPKVVFTPLQWSNDIKTHGKKYQVDINYKPIEQIHRRDTLLQKININITSTALDGSETNQVNLILTLHFRLGKPYPKPNLYKIESLTGYIEMTSEN